MQALRRFALVAFIAATAGLVIPVAVSAHEHRTIVDGKYSVVVGFLDEPAFTSFKNGLDLRVTTAAGTPAAGTDDAEQVGVEGLETTLQAEVIFGDQRMPLLLQPRWRDPGAYDGYLIPMAVGDYSFHIFGTINGDPVDEMFTSSPEGFSAVGDAATYQFPKQTASTSGTVAGTTSGVGVIGGVDDLTLGGVIGLVLGLGGYGLFRQLRKSAVFARRTAAGLQTGFGD